MDDAEVRHRRLRHQALLGPGLAHPAAVVDAFGAIQAQEYAMACWAVGLRTASGNEQAVMAAFDAGEILRTHVLRPTWHFVTPADLRWLLALSAPRVHALNAYQYRQLGLSPARLRRGADVIVRALAPGHPLTRDELQVHLARARLKLAGPALAYVVMYAELEGLICSGRRRGRQFTYELLDQRMAPAAPVTREESLVRLARKFFGTRGPATAHDFAAWSSLPLRDVATAVAALGPGFAHAMANGRPVYFPEDAAPRRQAARVTVLLPDYDEYGAGYRDRRAMFADAGASRRKSAYNRAVLLEGVVAGSWRRTLVGDRVEVELAFTQPPTPAQRKTVAAAVARYAAFLGRSVRSHPGISPGMAH